MKKLFAQVVNLDSIIKETVAQFISREGVEIDPDGQLAFESRSELVDRVREALSKAEIAVSVREDGSVGAGVDMPEKARWYKRLGKTRAGNVGMSFTAEFTGPNGEVYSGPDKFDYTLMSDCLVIRYELTVDGEIEFCFAVNKKVVDRIGLCGDSFRCGMKMNPFIMKLRSRGKKFAHLPDQIRCDDAITLEWLPKGLDEQDIELIKFERCDRMILVGCEAKLISAQDIVRELAIITVTLRAPKA